MKYLLIASGLLFNLLFFNSCSKQDSLIETKISSPNNSISAEITLNNEGAIFYTVKRNETILINPSAMGFDLAKAEDLNKGFKLINSTTSSQDTTWQRVWGKNKNVRDFYNEIKYEFAEESGLQRKLNIYFRVYNDGVGFKYEFPEQEILQEFEILNELTTFKSGDDLTVWATPFKGFYSHQEASFREQKLSNVDSAHLPMLVEVNEKNWIAISEANLQNYAGFHFKKKNEAELKLVLATDTSSIIAVKGKAPMQTPWRMIMIGNSPGDFITSNLLSNLNDPIAIDDPSWITPGISAWDWWWSNKYGPEVDFEIGPNTQTMKYYIDFAAEMGWEYQLVDWLWYGEPFKAIEGFDYAPDSSQSILTQEPQINIPEIVEYAKSKGVKTLIWLEWNHAKKEMHKAFPLYEKWGVAGVKVDFMAKETQEMVQFYNELVRLAAKHHLTVDFHGAYKPTGISRAYPNLLTREGIMGNEYNKWSDSITPEHTVTLPFTRGLLGEADFTPGGFENVNPEDFKTEEEGTHPMVMGTRTRQLAMFVCYESALQVACDDPYTYRNSPAGLDFLKQVPTTWDDTKVVNEKIGDYITLARKSGENWYLGSMTDGDARELSINLNFLDEGKYKATIWKDISNEDPKALMKEEIEVTKDSKILARLVSGGGHVMILEKQ